MSRRVLVTRPEPGATATGQRLARMGYEPVLMPLTRIEPVDPGEMPDLSAFAAAAATSANALRHAPSSLLQAIRALPLHCVGDRTAEFARGLGMVHVESGPGDGEGLADALASRVPPGARVIYLAGRERRPDFERRCDALGLKVTPVETYAAIAIEPAAERLEAVRNPPALAALFYSPRAASLFAQAARRANTIEFGETVALAISDNTAAALAGLSFRKVRVAATPDENALLTLLDACDPAEPSNR